MDLGVSRSSRDGGTILPNKQRLSGTDARARARRQLDLFWVPQKRKRNRVVTRGLQVREKANWLMRPKKRGRLSLYSDAINHIGRYG